MSGSVPSFLITSLPLTAVVIGLGPVARPASAPEYDRGIRPQAAAFSSKILATFGRDRSSSVNRPLRACRQPREQDDVQRSFDGFKGCSPRRTGPDQRIPFYIGGQQHAPFG